MTNPVTLGEVATLYDSLHKTPKEYAGNGYPMIRVTDIQKGFVSLDNTKLVDEQTYLEFSKKHKPMVGDVIYARVGNTFGKSSYVNIKKDFCLGQNLVCISADESKIDPYFLYSFLNSDDGQAQMRAKVAGGAQPTISLKSIKELSLVLPAIEEQNKIANAIQSYDNLIENNNRRIAILEEMAQSLYREWFVKFRFPGHENTKFIDSPLGKIPEGWAVVTVEELVKRYQTGKKYNNKTALSEGEVPILDQGKSGVIGYHNNEPGVVATEDDPIIVFANHTCYQKVIHYPFSAIQNVLPFKSIGGERERDLYWLHFVTKDVIEFNDYKGHWPEFMAKKIVLAPEELCSSFGVLAMPTERQKYKLECQIALLKKQRDLILPKLISGSVQI